MYYDARFIDLLYVLTAHTSKHFAPLQIIIEHKVTEN